MDKIEIGLPSIIVSQGSQLSPVTSTLPESVSQMVSLSSNMNIQSQPSINSQDSIESQASIQSELSLLSQSSLGFLPSLGSLMSGGTVGDGKVVDHRCVATIKGDQDGHVSSLALAGDYLYGGSSSGNNIRVWLRASLVERRRFGGAGDGAVKAVVVAGDRILSAHQDHKIRIWSRTRSTRREQLEDDQGLDGVDSHKLVAAMPTFKNYLKSFIPPKNYVQIRRHHKRLWIEHVDTISMLSIGGTPTNPLLYSASWDRTIKVWRLSDFHCLESFKAHDDAINAILVSPEGLVYTASADAKIKVWTKLPTAGQKQHSLVATLEGHKSAVNALALSQEGSILYSGACDRAIIVWEREESAQHMAVAGALRGHRHAILCLATAGHVLCSGSADRTIRVWKRIDSRRMHSCVAVLQGHKGPVKCLSVAMNEALDYLVYSSSMDHDIKIWWVARCIDDEERASTNEPSAEGNPRPQLQLISQWRHHSV